MGKTEGKSNEDAKLIREFLRFKADKAKAASPKKKAAVKKAVARTPSKKKEKVSDAEIASFLKLKQLCEDE